MRRVFRWWPRDRRQAQSGATLVELLVSVVIMGLALTLIVGTFSAGLLGATVQKRDTAATAVIQYELDQILAAPYISSAQPYSDCFATEDPSSPPAPASSYLGGCPSSSYSMRADLSVSSLGANTQRWTITLTSWPSGGSLGNAFQVQSIKVNR